MPRLRIKLKEEVTDIPVTGSSFVIGRTSECDYMIASGKVSRRHCEIRLEPQGYVITDLGSKLGTFLNGKRLEKTMPLNLSDVIKFSNHLEAVFMGDVAMTHTETLIAQKKDLQQDVERLVSLNGPLMGSEFPLHRNLTKIGRAADNHLVIPVDTVSSYHAEITQEGGVFVVRDLKSGNGTFVNGTRTTRQKLEAGSTVLFDWLSFRFEHVHYRMDAEGTVIQGELPDVNPVKDFTERTLKMDAQPGHLKADAIKTPGKRKKGFWGKLLFVGAALLGAAACWYYLIKYLL